MNITFKKWIVYVIVLIIFSAVSFYAGGKFSFQKHTNSDSLLDQKVVDEDGRDTTTLVKELKNSKNVYCEPFSRQVWPYNDFTLYDKTVVFPVVQNLDIQKEFCDFLLEKGPSVLENITFSTTDYPPYFSGYATLSFKQEPISSPTSTYSIVYNQVYLVSFTLTKMNDSSYQLVINQIALLDSADKVKSQSILSLGENGRQLKITGVDVAGEEFEHYFRTGVNKANDPYFGEITNKN